MKNLFVVLLAAVSFLSSQTLLPQFYGTDGTVKAVAASGNSLYIGGTFAQVGFPCGTSALLDTASGEADRFFPKFDDRIFMIISDSAGGWFVAGQFSHVQGFAVKGLAHIRADHSVDTTLNLKLDGFVNAVVLFDSTLYLGGTFQSVLGTTRNYCASYDLRTRQLTAWNPNPNNIVTALHVRKNFILVGGYFTSIGGQGHLVMAGVNTTSGAAVGVLLGATGGPSGISHVKRFVEKDGKIYCGGIFSSINGLPRINLCALDTGTAAVDSLWNPGVNYSGGGINDMLAAGDRIFVSGWFTALGGASRNYLAALDPKNGSALPWNPNPNADAWAMTMVGNRLAVSGMFSSIGGKLHKFIAMVDTSSGASTLWDPKIDENSYALNLQGGMLFAGGRFSSVNNVPRANLAAIDVTTGKVRPWIADASGPVNALTVFPKGLIVGGSFSGINSSSQSNLVVLDTATAAIVPFFPSVNAQVYAIHPMKTRIYAGGQFTSVGGSGRNGLAAFDASTGKVLSWNPVQNSGGGLAFASIRSTIYVAGFFTKINNVDRNYCAAFDTTTDQLLPWAPNPDGWVQTMAVWNSSLVLGGDFFNLGGTAHKRLGVVDGVNGTPTPFNIQADITVSAVKVSGNTLLAGGTFTKMNALPRNSFAMIDLASSTVLPYAPITIGQYLNSIALGEGRIYLGGTQLGALNVPVRYITAFAAPGITAKQPITASLSAKQIDFGNVVVGQAKDSVLLISNNGDDTLSIQSQSISSPFTLRSSVLSIAPFATAAETIRFVPSAAGTVQQPFIIVSTSVTGPDTVLLSGTGTTGPRTVTMTTGQDTVNFGTVLLDHFKDTVLVIGNTGNDSLHVLSVISTDPRFTVKHSSVTIAAGQSFADTIRFSAAVVGTYKAFLLITSDATVNAVDTVVVMATVQKVTGAPSNRTVPMEFVLHQNFPNPFNPSTTIAFTVPHDGPANLTVVNLLGQTVATLIDGPVSAGVLQTVRFDGVHCAGGIYFARLQHGGKTEIIRMVLLK